MWLKDRAARVIQSVATSRSVILRRCPDFPAETMEVIERVRSFTMTSPERIAALCEAVRYVEANDIPGAFVECGVWRGGSTMAAALTFERPRAMLLYDTFEGMSTPTERDRRASDGKAASALLATATKSETIWCAASLEDVTTNIASTGYPMERVTCIRGRVEDTIPATLPAQIAILRLDTDWYDSTRHELEHLYPLLAPGGVLIIDDYGYWEGARRAVDEYFGGKLFLSRIDNTGRVAIKPLEPFPI
jgi:hypothetical protein